MTKSVGLDALVAYLAGFAPRDRRYVVAVAGPPASGKSTQAKALVDALNAEGRTTALVPMDGFHLDNATLDAHGLRAVKGAPQTFDLAGFDQLLSHLVLRLDVTAPSFDREKDAVVPNGIAVPKDAEFAIVEGNYLLLKEPGWDALAKYWDVKVWLDVSREVLEKRLMARWLDLGLGWDKASQKTRENDLPNGERVISNSAPADFTLTL